MNVEKIHTFRLLLRDIDFWKIGLYGRIFIKSLNQCDRIFMPTRLCFCCAKVFHFIVLAVNHSCYKVLPMDTTGHVLQCCAFGYQILRLDFDVCMLVSRPSGL